MTRFTDRGGENWLVKLDISIIFDEALLMVPLVSILAGFKAGS